ncbi:hypothetical protein ATJ97_2129 [Georgenia soli]|uniref:Uncharacterized protein n=2 Tax=Georgenia soli TaxID=638953 RepID=A0A2A9EL34_9MICO|nr:hypothetical protein ATJ97_2129 [Georgenia soli]
MRYREPPSGAGEAVADALHGARTSDVAAGRTTRPPAAPPTERILAALPGSRPLLIVVWGLVPWLNLAAVALLAPSWPGGIPWGEVLNRTATSFAVVLSLWGVSRITEELRRLQVRLTDSVEEARPDVEHLFRGLDSVTAPLVLLAATGVVLPLDEMVRAEPGAALIQGVTWVVIGIPLCTAFWVYVALQLGLIRLGRGHVTLRDYDGDRTLGLQPVGRLAFTGFWLILGSVGPVVLTGLSDLPVTLVGAGVLVAAVALFFLSLSDLHRQMVAVKERERAQATELYRQAYRDLRGAPTLDVLQQHAGLLGAAESLERRAERIQEWPFDEGTFARVVTIASSAGATILARLLLAPTGL